MRHLPRQQLARHPHAQAFAAVALSGGYVEAGDTGRHYVEPGDVLLHKAWESHIDRIDSRGAEVLVLPIRDEDAHRPAGRLADPDVIARLAERDLRAAAGALLAQLLPKVSAADDWPDQLAQALAQDPGLCLGEWADLRGLHVGSVSRGFRQLYGVAPVEFRLIQRARHAIDALRRTAAPLSGVAQDCGFADQAHMSRAIHRLTGLTPSMLRKGAA
jgi:AraC-like DNA-binding protein